MVQKLELLWDWTSEPRTLAMHSHTNQNPRTSSPSMTGLEHPNLTAKPSQGSTTNRWPTESFALGLGDIRLARNSNEIALQ